MLRHDSSNYSLNWKIYNASFSPQNSLYSAFQYRDASSLDSLPYAGRFGNYLGGGYVYEIDTSVNRASLISDLTQLQSMDWIDQRTRAVFLEYSLFNANIGMFAYCTLLFEILSTGGIIKFSQFNAFSAHSSGTSQVEFYFDILYFMTIIFLALRQIRAWVRLGWRKYLRQKWIYPEWLLIIFTLVTFIMFIYRLHALNSFLGKLNERQTKPTQVVRLQNLSMCDEMFQVFLALCSFIGILKFVKLLVVNPTVKSLMDTLGQSFGEISAVTSISGLFLCCFANGFYLLYFDKASDFSTLFKTVESLFLVILGKLNASLFTSSPNLLGPLFLIAFSFVMIFIMLNFFIILLSHKFLEQKRKLEEERNAKFHRLGYTEYFTSKIKDFVTLCGLGKRLHIFKRKRKLGPEDYIPSPTFETTFPRTIKRLKIFMRNSRRPSIELLYKVKRFFDLKNYNREAPTSVAESGRTSSKALAARNAQKKIKKSLERIEEQQQHLDRELARYKASFKRPIY